MLAVLPLQFTLVSQGMNLPPFCGLLWHSILGPQLAAASPAAFECLYGDNGAMRPYAISPPGGGRHAPGAEIALGISLFGQAALHAPYCAQAVARQGREGMPHGAGRFRLGGIRIPVPGRPGDFLRLEGEAPAWPAPAVIADYLPPIAGECQALRLWLATPLRAKAGNRPVRAAPSCELLLQRLFGRLEQLAWSNGAEPWPARETQAGLLALAREVRITAAGIEPARHPRRSGRTGQAMAFEGICGHVDYQGPLTEILPWLRLAELVQIGEKTTFGFGRIEISPLSPSGSPLP